MQDAAPACLTSPLIAHGAIRATLEAVLGQPNATLAVLMVELADVSRLQARLGFAASEKLLGALQHGFGNALGARGSVARLSDGRFCVILQAIRNEGHAMLAAQKLLRVADDVMSDLALKSRLHVGIALHPVQASDAESLLQSAQIAVTAARSRSVHALMFDEQCAAHIMRPWELSEAFAHALEGGELSVYYQPKIRLDDQRTSGVESLMRWLHGGKAVATPDVFIPLAEEAGLIDATTWYAFSNSLRMSAEQDGLPVAVNITPGMLHHREFIDMVRSAMATWSVRDRCLTLEITESGLIEDFGEASERLNKLRDSGVRISIDDFGTGYSSLSYFKKIPADELKIDKSFVMNMMTDSGDRRLVGTILDLARQFNLETVAEGVENRATGDALAEMGCRYAQGFLYAPALSAEALKQWLQVNPRA